MTMPPKVISRAATLTDVARAAGVGESTASRVLRNKGSFSHDVHDRVLQAARNLNYVPNRIAGTLASTGSQLIGVIIPALTTSVFPDLLRGSNSVLESAGYQSVIGVTEYEAAREEQLIESILSWRPAGILIAGLEHTDRGRAMLKDSGVRVVEVGDTDGQGIDIVVGFSNRGAGQAAAEYLLRRKYRRIGMSAMKPPTICVPANVMKDSRPPWRQPVWRWWMRKLRRACLRSRPGMTG
jgi:LacI family gluconate utilization system Gnt-I transcriptional repressor